VGTTGAGIEFKIYWIDNIATELLFTAAQAERRVVDK
jgi:hypothetical protein